MANELERKLLSWIMPDWRPGWDPARVGQICLRRSILIRCLPMVHHAA